MTIPILSTELFTATIFFVKKTKGYKPMLKVYMKKSESKKYCKSYPYWYTELNENIKKEDWLKKITENDILQLIIKKQPVKNNDRLLLSTLIYNCKLRAKRDGLKFSLNEKDIINLYNSNPNCALSNIPLSLKKGYMTSISIDRIDNKYGYNKNNIQLVCKSINFMKNNHSDIECKIFIEQIKKN